MIGTSDSGGTHLNLPTERKVITVSLGKGLRKKCRNHGGFPMSFLFKNMCCESLQHCYSCREKHIVINL